MSITGEKFKLPTDLQTQARLLHRELKRRGLRVVFAESCTGGLISGALARIPGISEHLCGSAVAYRADTKTRWLGVPAALIKREGIVSERVAVAMAEGVLARTPEADIAGAITGYLGPGAPLGEEGRVCVAVAMRGVKRAIPMEYRLLPEKSRATQGITRSSDGRKETPESLRIKRQELASLVVLFMVRSLLEFAKPSRSRM